MSKETGVSVEGQFSIPDVLSTIREKIKSLNKIETTKFKTKMNLPGFGDLQKVDKVEDLIKAFSMVEGKEIAFDRAAKSLGQVGGKFQEQGNSVEEWKHDINLRISILNYGEELKNLKALEKEASQFLSQEDQKAMFLQKLAGSLGV